MRTVEATNQIKLGHSHSPRSIVLDSKRAFELWAEVYDDLPNPIVHRSERAIIQGLQDIRGFRVADLACGTGRLLAQLSHLAPTTCVGFDLSNAMLQKARLKEELTGRLIRADLHELPVLSGSLDLVTFSLGLSYFRNLFQVAQEIQRILKPGGRVLCTDLHPTTSELGWKRNFTLRNNHYEVTHHPHTAQDVLQAFSMYFQLGRTLDLFFGDAERDIFECAGKSALFEELRSRAALILFEWTKPAATFWAASNKPSDSLC